MQIVCLCNGYIDGFVFGVSVVWRDFSHDTGGTAIRKLPDAMFDSPMHGTYARCIVTRVVFGIVLVQPCCDPMVMPVGPMRTVVRTVSGLRSSNFHP